MKEKNRKKLLGEEIMEKINAGEMFSDRSSIHPETKKDAIKKRLCSKIKSLRNHNKEKSIETLAEEWSVSKTTLLSILNFNTDKVTIDTCIDILEINSKSNKEAYEALVRIAMA